MGITVNEPYTLNNGITVNSYYANLDSKSLMIHKNMVRNILRYNNDTPPQLEKSDKVEYNIISRFNIYVSKEAFLGDSVKTIDRKMISLKYDEAPIRNIYNLIYTEFKKGLTDFQDNL